MDREGRGCRRQTGQLASHEADFAQVGAVLWQRFRRGRDEQEWYYRSIFQALISQSSHTPPEFLSLLAKYDETLEHFFLRTRCSRTITVKRDEAERCRDEKVDGRCRWLLAIDGETLAARFVQHDHSGFVAEAQGHEDFFPVGMLFEHEDAFLEAGDWTSVSTSKLRLHDGVYRSYHVKWA